MNGRSHDCVTANRADPAGKTRSVGSVTLGDKNPETSCFRHTNAAQHGARGELHVRQKADPTVDE